MTDRVEKYMSQLQSTQQREESVSDEAEWIYGYGPFRYCNPTDQQGHAEFPGGKISGIFTSISKDSQSDYTEALQVQIYEKALPNSMKQFLEEWDIHNWGYEKALPNSVKQFLEEWDIRNWGSDESLADEESARSVVVEEQVDDSSVDTMTDDISQWTSDHLYSAILDADSESDMPRLREIILVAEDAGFTVAQSEQLAPWLLSFAERRRDSSDPHNEAAVWSAIRTGASMLTPHDVDNLRPLLEPGHSIETSLVTVKMLGRIFEAQPPAEIDEHRVLAGEACQIAESLLNRYAITVSQSAAMAQLAIYAIAAMASSETQRFVETIQQLGVTWFTQQTLRELRELRNIWASRPVPVAERPRELLTKALQTLGRD